ncbi:hypothetical protein GCM10028819_39090 [Spirosoma humi]
MKSSQTIIKTDGPLVAFKRHFNDKDNKRIVFSGRFGSGKTFFLNEFFESQKDKVNTFWLSPVKYAVSQNEDIFEYIKVDIAYHLIKDGHIKPILKKHFSEDLYIDQYIKNKPLEIVKLLAYAMQSIKDVPEPSAKITASLGTAIEKLTFAFDTYKKFKGAINEKLKNDYDILGDYLKTSTESKGSIYENDLITQTIQVALEFCREEIQNAENIEGVVTTQNVLIIDDFDRLDPEHIFRILNILSVHNDHLGSDNKFGFDKIIIVCDIDNIQNIYAYRYGDKVDFNGYMSKFFSLDIFHFDNSAEIQYFCLTELKSVIEDEDAEIVLGLFLAHFVKSGILTIRNIIKYDFYKPMEDHILKRFEIASPKPHINSRIGYSNIRPFLAEGIQSFYIHSSDFPILQAIRLLSIIFGDYNKMKKAFSETSDNMPDSFFSERHFPSVVKALAPILNVSENYTDPGKIVFGVETATSEITWVNYPNYNFFDRTIKIDVGWTEVNPYNGQRSYYEKVKENMKLAKFTASILDSPKSLKYLLIKGKRIFDVIEQSSLLTLWGMTK